MRIISANLQHGTPPAGKAQSRDHWQVLAQQFSDYHPDAICLQEVDFYQARSGFVDQTRALADALTEVSGKKWQHRFLSFYAGQVLLGLRLPVTLPSESLGKTRNPFRADRPLLGGYGVGLLTPHPVRRWVSAKLGSAAPRINISSPDPRNWKFYGGQTRSLLGAEITTPQGQFLVGDTHLDLGVDTAKRQLIRSWQGMSLLAGKATPLLVGDMNLRQEVSRTVYPYLTFASAPTFPADQPRFHIDQLFAPPTCQVSQVDTMEMPISDHLALFVDLHP